MIGASSRHVCQLLRAGTTTSKRRVDSIVTVAGALLEMRRPFWAAAWWNGPLWKSNSSSDDDAVSRTSPSGSTEPSLTRNRLAKSAPKPSSTEQ